MLRQLKNSLLSLGFPVECRVCGGELSNIDDGVACGQCWSATTLFSGREMLCAKCGSYFGPNAAPTEVFCHQCDDHHYRSASAVGIYEKALAASILRLKTEPSIASRPAELLSRAIKRIGFETVDLIIPIPLSKQRQLERGFNQAEIISRLIARNTKIKVDAHSLIRTSHTLMHRVGMDKRARELTVINAFDVVRPNLVNGRSVLLVDDVFTSGSTASYCAKALKKAGVTSVDVLTLARAVIK